MLKDKVGGQVSGNSGYSVSKKSLHQNDKDSKDMTSAINGKKFN